jgi:hypothetical protein
MVSLFSTLLVSVLLFMAPLAQAQTAEWLSSVSNPNTAPALPSAIVGPACDSTSNRAELSTGADRYNGGQSNSGAGSTIAFSSGSASLYRTFRAAATPLPLSKFLHGYFTSLSADNQTSFEVIWGGITNSVAATNDIWISVNSGAYSQFQGPTFSPRFNFMYTSIVDESVPFSNVKLGYMYGGVDSGGNLLDDFWTISNTGVATQVAPGSLWGARTGMGLKGYRPGYGDTSAVPLAIGTGGLDDVTGAPHNDVWTLLSIQGNAWTVATRAAPWLPRYDANLWTAPFHTFLYGGTKDGLSLFTDLWYSTDSGSSWTQLAMSNTQFAPVPQGVGAACTSTAVISSTQALTVYLIAVAGGKSPTTNLGVLQVTF